MSGRTTALGYGYKHQQERRKWERQVEAGGIVCWRCGYAIIPGQPWDLGHDDYDRTRYKGPEHIKCNRGAPGRRRGRIHRIRRLRDPGPSRTW